MDDAGAGAAATASVAESQGATSAGGSAMTPHDARDSDDGDETGGGPVSPRPNAPRSM